MIKKLKTRQRFDTVTNDKRGGRRQIGRYVYLGILAGILITVANALIGPMLFMQSDGLVLLDKQVIASEFPARIEKVHVVSGQFVRKGTPLVTLMSHDVMDSIAKLSARRAELSTRQAKIKARLNAVGALQPLAEQRLKQTAEFVEKLNRLSKRQLTTATRHAATMRDYYEAQREQAQLQSEAVSLKDELATLAKSAAELDKALADYRQSYNDGHIVAAQPGVVGADVPSPGEVVTAGKPILEIMVGLPYVLAYLPTGRLYEVSDGEEIIISDGIRSVVGHIERLKVVADALPNEFQQTFKPKERQQLMRVSFDDPPPFPFLSRVYVTKGSGPRQFVNRIKSAFLNKPSVEQLSSHMQLFAAYSTRVKDDDIVTGSIPGKQQDGAERKGVADRFGNPGPKGAIKGAHGVNRAEKTNRRQVICFPVPAKGGVPDFSAYLKNGGAGLPAMPLLQEMPKALPPLKAMPKALTMPEEMPEALPLPK